MTQKEVFGRGQTLEKAIHDHGLPIILVAAGSGSSVEITEPSEISSKTDEICDKAAVMGNGIVIKDE
ncbi:MAG: hypothetical protein CMI56_02465 [Parcubacteria group bacterium]|nr:hypothetical protein [Parcubacteria group bacterium]